MIDTAGGMMSPCSSLHASALCVRGSTRDGAEAFNYEAQARPVQTSARKPARDTLEWPDCWVAKVAVKIEPLPGRDSTVRSPPILRHSWREMSRPSPVPPYLRVVLPASACRRGNVVSDVVLLLAQPLPPLHAGHAGSAALA